MEPESPTDPRLDIARRQIEFARAYTLSLLQDIADEDWYRVPTGSPTHVAWQVAHLAMAEYGLCLFRLRGRHEDDSQLMPSSFRKQFSKGSAPNPDASKCPTPAQIRDVFQKVHEQALRQLQNTTLPDVEQPVDEPYAVYPTKLGALFFCSAHEMMHAGQIGLLRRLLGKNPIR